MRKKQDKKLDVASIVPNKRVTNRLIKIIMIVAIISIVIDLSLLKIYDLIPKNPHLSDRKIVFSAISSVFILSQIFILRYIKQLNIQFLRTRLFQIIHTVVTLVQLVLVMVVLLVSFQIWFEPSYTIAPVTLAIGLSYGLGIVLMGYLSYRFFIWLRYNFGMTVLLYLLASALITTSAFFTLLFLYSISSMYTLIAPKVWGSGVYLTSFQGISLLLTNVFATLSFITTWLATALLLSNRSSHIGKAKYWTIVFLPLLYFLSQFVSLFTSGFTSDVFSDPVSSGIALTMIFALSKLAGGIMFGFAFWTMSKTMAVEFVIPKNLIMIAGYGYVILFMSTQTVAFSILPYPPFGFSTILFYGVSSYMIFVGIYFSVIVISQDSELRRTIKKVTEGEPTLLADISYSQLESVIEKRTMRLVQGLAQEPVSNLANEESVNENFKNYAFSVINELQSYDPMYLKIVEKEREMLAGSKIFLACVSGKLLEFMMDDHSSLFSKLMDQYRLGTYRGIKVITSIDNTVLAVVEELFTMGIEVKHISNLTSKQIIMSDKFVLKIPVSGKNIDSRLQIEDSMVDVNSCHYEFEHLWNSSKDAIDKIKELKSDSSSC